MDFSSEMSLLGSGERHPKKPSISIAMATYNGGKYIRKQLESLANQTYYPFELVVTDDVSTDMTCDILHEFVRVAPFKVHIYRNERRMGVLQNFIKAANLCRGDYIAFCDQDDIWLPHKLKACVPWLRKENVSLVSHAAFLIDEEGQKTGHSMQTRARTVILQPSSMGMNFALWGFTILFKRECLLTINSILSSDFCPPIPPRFLHDSFVHSLAPLYGKTVLLRDKLALYRQHSGMVTDGIPTKRRNIFTLDAELTRTHLQGKAIQFKFLADCLTIVSELEDSFIRACSLTGRDRYEVFERRSLRRLNLYNTCESGRQKIACFAELLFCGDYVPRFMGGFGIGAFFRDIFFLAMQLIRQKVSP